MDSIRQHRAMTAPNAEPETGVAASPDRPEPAERDRRMHLRAYNHWASMLDRRRFPTVADLANGAPGDIAHHSVLLDVSTEAESPKIAYLGERLAQECGAEDDTLRHLSDAPEGSLVGRLAGHLPTVLANRAPTGFEAEFASTRGLTLLYRGMLLPFSSDGSAIDYVLAVVNWKEVAEGPAEHRPAEPTPAGRRTPAPAALLTDWADGPGSELGDAADPVLSSTLDRASVDPGETQNAFPPEEAPLTGGAGHHVLPEGLAEQLREMPLQSFGALSPTGAEFSLAIIRRPVGGPAAFVGEVHDPALIAQAAQLLGR